jgi:hypothetical protein
MPWKRFSMQNEGSDPFNSLSQLILLLLLLDTPSFYRTSRERREYTYEVGPSAPQYVQYRVRLPCIRREPECFERQSPESGDKQVLK